jgi:hypothetical protein
MRHYQEPRSLLSQRERDQPEGARRGGKEAAEVARADRDEGASEAQAAKEDLARQIGPGPLRIRVADAGLLRRDWRTTGARADG